MPLCRFFVRYKFVTYLCLYSSIVVPTGIYASETWKTTNKINKMIDVFHRRCLRSILGISWRDHVTNEEVMARTGQAALHDTVATRRRRFVGHILRLPTTRPASLAIMWTVETRRRQEEGRKTKEDMAKHTEGGSIHTGCWCEWRERYCQRPCQMETTRRPMFWSEREELSLSLSKTYSLTHLCCRWLIIILTCFVGIWLVIRSSVTAIYAGCRSIFRVTRSRRVAPGVKVLAACSVRRSVLSRTTSFAAKVCHCLRHHAVQVWTRFTWIGWWVVVGVGHCRQYPTEALALCPAVSVVTFWMLCNGPFRITYHIRIWQQLTAKSDHLHCMTYTNASYR